MKQRSVTAHDIISTGDYRLLDTLSDDFVLFTAGDFDFLDEKFADIKVRDLKLWFSQLEDSDDYTILSRELNRRRMELLEQRDTISVDEYEDRLGDLTIERNRSIVENTGAKTVRNVSYLLHAFICDIIVGYQKYKRGG